MSLINLLRNPIFFDRIGIFVFLFIIIDALFDLKSMKYDKQRWRAWTRLVIGIFGLIVDTTLVSIH